MASYWEKNGLNIFFSDYQEDYQEAQEVVVEEESPERFISRERDHEHIMFEAEALLEEFVNEARG